MSCDVIWSKSVLKKTEWPFSGWMLMDSCFTDYRLNLCEWVCLGLQLSVCSRTHCPKNSYVSGHMVNTRLELPSPLPCSHTPFTPPPPPPLPASSPSILSFYLSNIRCKFTHSSLSCRGHSLCEHFPPPDLVLSLHTPPLTPPPLPSSPPVSQPHLMFLSIDVYIYI